MITSFPSTTGVDNLASPAPPIQAPTGFSTVPLPSTPTTSLDFASTSLLTHLGLGVATAPGSLSGSLFTTTMVYTSDGHVYTTVSTGVLGTGRPVPHDFAHNVGAIIGVAIGGVVALILIVLAAFCACQRFRPRAHREFMLYGAAKGLRHPRGAWRSPIDGDSVYSLVSESVDDHGDTSLLEAESGMREVRASQNYWGSAPPFLDAADISSSHAPDSFTQTPDLISMQDAIWVPTPPSSLSIPALLAADGGRPSDLSIPSRSSLLNPPLAPSMSTVALPSPTTPQPEWPGLRGSITQSLPLVAEPLPSAAEPTTPLADPLPSPATTEEPHVAEGLLRPSLTVLQSHSSRTFDDHVDYSRLIGAQRTGSGNTFDTTSSKAVSSVQ
ncbi:hypothetical protein DFH08DRAFT_1000490 [Mycena albidolilacea]|uniref:Transmembrane protein n=1 Tax=Mycena albidolilacea TaxID=1033008 RepID=A0AAD7A336_9AGAR|nr:hypothetical protein DFH08DRAFT_1000490 [Mycena albidolilacea]